MAISEEIKLNIEQYTPYPVGARKTSTIPKMDGEASIGNEKTYAAGDHVHPSDTSKLSTNRLGAVNGVCPLDSSAKINERYLPDSVSSEFESVEDDLTLLSARVDAIASLEEGSTTGDAELIDGRVGADGVTYPDIGDAIRTQVSDLKSALSDKFAVTRNILNVTKSTVGMVNSSGAVVGSTGRTSDFIPCEAETKYYSSYNYGVQNAFPYVVGYYDANKDFLSRLVNSTDEVYFTTPSGCAFIRISLRNATNEFSKDKQITKDGIYPYRYATEVLSETAVSQDVEDLRLNVFGISDNNIQPYFIAATDKWGYQHTAGVFGYHVCIPIKEGDSISIIANDKNSAVWAMLTSDRWKKVGESPDYVATYNMGMDDDGNIDWQPIVDGGGNPVLDTRHAVDAKQSISFIAVPNSKCLYLTANIGDVAYLPKSLIINGHQYINNKTATNIDEQMYETILFDDFDTFDASTWKKLTNEPLERGTYNSRFITTEDNVWCEQSMLVMKCNKPSTPIDLGTYIDHDGNEQSCEYVASYISSEESYVIPSGRISARIRTNQKMEKHFPWCFWTFGQGAVWGYAHEMDIAELVFTIQSGEVVSQNGTTVTDGSIKNILKSTVHARDSNGDAVMSNYYYNVSANIKSDDTYSSETELSNKLLNIDVEEWHEYTVIWDTDTVDFFVDGELVKSITATSIDAVNENGVTGFTHPQDIRFNIKATEWSIGDEAEMFVDWIKVERLTKVPALSISHSDVSLAVGNSVYINPTFNTDCSNKAFSVEVDGDSVRYDKYLTEASKMVVHKLVGVSVGVSTITIKSANGVTMGTFAVTVS